MKICFVANNINPKAGLGRMVSSIANSLQNRGHEIGFVVSSGESNCPILKVEFRFFSRRIFTTIYDLCKMRSFVKDYDVIVCFDVKPAGILAHLATLGRPDVIVVHSLGTYSLFTLSSRLKNKFISYIYKNSDRIWLINDFVKKKIEGSNKLFAFADNIDFIPVGVDTTLFRVIDNPNEVPGKEYIISVGNIKSRKGQFESIKAFSLIVDAYPDLRYVLVGSITDSPNYYNQIVNYIKKHNLSDKIIFKQDISDERLVNLYNGAKFFILTPTSTEESIEGFGMVYLESALCGIPSIGTFDTGAEAAIVDKKTGLLVNQEAGEIAKAMKILLNDHLLREEYAHNARERAVTFGWDNVVDLYESKLEKLIDNQKNIC